MKPPPLPEEDDPLLATEPSSASEVVGSESESLAAAPGTEAVEATSPAPAPSNVASAGLKALADGEVLVLRGGSYTLLRRLGRGGMAEVWLARRDGAAGFQREVALKRILPEYLEDDDARTYLKMFVDEARLAATLHHPAIAQVHDLQEDAGAYYLVMEYVPGRTLRDALHAAARRGLSFSPGFACHVVAHIADALHHAYNARSASGKPLRIVHRDVSPVNVMVGESGEVKLLDFGIAYSFIENRDRTRTGFERGTWHYRSPEQTMGSRELDTRSDLFVLGIVLTEILTNRRPFDAGPNRDTLAANRLMAATQEDVRQVTRDLPADLGAIAERLLARDPGDRFQTGAEVAAALRAFMVKEQLAYGAAQAVQELRELEAAPLPEVTSTVATGPTCVAGLGVPVSSAREPPVSSGIPPPSETQLARRKETRERLENPENPKPRLLKPLVLVIGVAIAIQLAIVIVVKLNRGPARAAAAPAEVVKTATQMRAEREAEQRAIAPKVVQPALAEVRDPSATLAASVNGAGGPSGAGSGDPPTAPSQAVPRKRSRAQGTAAGSPRPARRYRVMDSPLETMYADAASAAPVQAGASMSVARGTVIAARLLTPADASNPGPVAAVVAKDVVVNGAVVIPAGSSLDCSCGGSSSTNRVNVTCESLTVGGRAIGLSGIALGTDELRGIPVTTSGGDGTGEPARHTALDTAARVATRLLPGGDALTGDLVAGAVSAGTETARRGTAPTGATLHPAPKGTRFFVYVNSFGGSL